MKFTATYNGQTVVGLIQQPKLTGTSCSAWVVLTDSADKEVDRILLSSAHESGNMFDTLFNRIKTTTFFKDVEKFDGASINKNEKKEAAPVVEKEVSLDSFVEAEPEVETKVVAAVEEKKEVKKKVVRKKK